MLSHYNLVANMKQCEPLRSSAWKNNCLMAVLPFFHVYGMIIIMAYTLRYGFHCITMPGFEPKLFLQAIEKYKVRYAIFICIYY